MYRRMGLIIIILSSLLLVYGMTSVPVYAATFLVDDSGDASDADTSNGVCATVDGTCTLRAAIEQANANGAADIINFDGSVTSINIGTELAISSDITINGSGVTVDNTGTGRVFFINAGSVIISGLTITGGTATDGGGLYVSGSLADVTLQGGAQVTGNNATTWGSGIFAENNAQLTVTGAGTAITNNGSAGPTTAGGGIAGIGGADIFITNGAVVSNHTGGVFGGGGIGLDASTGSTTLTVDNATISGNNASLGGGIYAQSGVTITLQNGAVITQNSANNGGGIILASGSSSLTVTNARITFNTASGTGAAIFQSGGSTAVSNSCIVCNGDDAIRANGGTFPLALANNWWGSPWGPYYSTAGDGLQCSTGDSLATNTMLANYGISVTTPSTCDGSAPVGNWLTAATAGCTGNEIAPVSAISHARMCTSP